MGGGGGALAGLNDRPSPCSASPPVHVTVTRWGISRLEWSPPPPPEGSDSPSVHVALAGLSYRPPPALVSPPRWDGMVLADLSDHHRVRSTPHRPPPSHVAVRRRGISRFECPRVRFPSPSGLSDRVGRVNGSVIHIASSYTTDKT